MSPQFTDDDVGKDVVNDAGDEVGMVVDVDHGTAHVEPDPGITDSIKATLGWTDSGEDTYPLQEAAVGHVTDDAIHLEGDRSSGRSAGTGGTTDTDPDVGMTDTGTGDADTELTGSDTDTGTGETEPHSRTGGSGTESDRGIDRDEDDISGADDEGAVRRDEDDPLMDDDDDDGLIDDDDDDRTSSTR
ncbi:hypothetical protein ACERIM_00300 [Natrinema sp. H-ect1]|uniref:hypothetical protein n=1 Tax=Natrinema sp. H-ect1 TaxID=3242700 RepID=UPI00359CC5C3